jgi:hypothetical protein
MVLFANQRPMTAIAPMLAAQNWVFYGYIHFFSWDNLPKATMVLETDYILSGVI